MRRTIEGTQILKTFIENFESNSGHVHHVRDLDMLSESLTQVLRANNLEKVVEARLPSHIKNVVSRVLERENIRLLEGKSPSEIDEADAGLTLADYGIADTGTIVEITELDRDRLVSSLPRVHIAFLRVDNILPSLEVLSDYIKKALSKSDERKVISLISGPSRTADIELRQVLGVHGPHMVHVITGGMI